MLSAFGGGSAESGDFSLWPSFDRAREALAEAALAQTTASASLVKREA
jgi:hypothetical protein